MSDDIETELLDPNIHTAHSSYREKLIEHLFVAELLKLSWRHHGCALEVAKPEVDNAGYDLIAEMPGCVRHIQLKTMISGGKAAFQKVHAKLADKPSGCVVWICFDEKTLILGPFLYFGSEAGYPLPSLSGFPIATHTKGNKDGFKAERPNIRKIPKGKFQEFGSIDELFAKMFRVGYGDVPDKTMKTKIKEWSWSEGPVDRTEDHFELRYDPDKKEDWDQWLPVALVGQSNGRKFATQFLISQGGDPRYAEIIKQVKQELDFFLVEKGEPDPWGYAQYHCGTLANAYSQVHWSFFPTIPATASP